MENTFEGWKHFGLEYHFESDVFFLVKCVAQGILLGYRTGYVLVAFSPGSNPHDVMKLLQEMKGLQCTLDETVYYGFQQYIRSADSQLFGQPTLPSMFQRQTGGAAPGGAHGPV